MEILLVVSLEGTLIGPLMYRSLSWTPSRFFKGVFTSS